MDFNAWCEVWIADRWHVVDARHNIARIGRILIARGRDAADVAMINSFGPHDLGQFRLWTHVQEHDRLDMPFAPQDPALAPELPELASSPCQCPPEMRLPPIGAPSPAFGSDPWRRTAL